MPNHTKPHTMAHWTVPILHGIHTGKSFLIIDWFDRWTAGAHKARKLPSMTSVVMDQWQRLIDEGLDVTNKTPEQLYTECLFGKLEHKLTIFHQDSLDLEKSRAQAPE